MRYVLEVRSKPVEDMQQKHRDFMARLSTVKSEWGLARAEWPQVKDPGTLPMRLVSLTKYFHKGIKALVSYQNRVYLRDEARFDDYFTLEFDPAKHDYESLARRWFEKHVEWFHAYRGDIGDKEFIYLDFDNARHIDGRSDVYRLFPVFFLGNDLCARSFHRSPQEIADRISRVVERATVLSSGILVIGSSRIMTIQKADALNDKLKALLGAGDHRVGTRCT